MSTEGIPKRETTESETASRAIVRNLEFIDKSVSPSDLRYTHIIEHLESSGHLDTEVARVKSLLSADLGEFGETLDEDVWKMLTVLELFDSKTVQHCVETYHIAKRKIEHTFFEDRATESFSLRDSFKREGVELSAFYRACLLHDIGKVEVPYSIVVNRVTDAECTELLFQHTDDVLIPALKKHTGDERFTLPSHVASRDSLLEYLHETLHIRPQTVAPVRLLLGTLPSTEITQIEQQLSHCGCTLEDSLITVMQTHDRYSQQILLDAKMPIEAILAGSHHISNEQKFKITVGAIQVSIDLAHIIHLADVQNAILQMRHYKPEQTPLEALKILAIHAQHKYIDSYIAYIWIADELQKISAEENSSNPSYSYIVNFLNSQKQTHLGYPDWKLP